MPNLEETSPSTGTIVFMGKHVGFIFSLDLRDECVDGQVVKVCDGKMKRNWEGGYSSNLFSHFVKYNGYREKPDELIKPIPGESGDVALLRMIDAWVGLLIVAGESLLSDNPQSLSAGIADTF